jgi:hypothetical protein
VRPRPATATASTASTSYASRSARPSNTPAPSPAARSAAPASASGSASGYGDDYDIPLDLDLDPAPPPSELDGIDDYAHISNPTFTPSRSTPSQLDTPTPSPPLSVFPNDSYRPLPLATSNSTSSSSLPGEAPVANENDWSVSFAGLSQQPFEKDVRDALLKPLEKDDIEVKPGECALKSLYQLSELHI